MKLKCVLLASLAVFISVCSASSVGASSLTLRQSAIKHKEPLDVTEKVRGGAAPAQTTVAKSSSSSNTPGLLGVVGGVLCHLALGSTYCWGNFSPYAPKRLKFFDGVGSIGAQPDTLWVLPGTFIAQMLTMPLGPYLQKSIGCKWTTLVGCWMMALGTYLSSYAPNLAVFMLCYSLLFGAGVGIAYTAPMVNGWRWFPNSKGLVSGFVVAGFGAGGFIFNQVGSRIINPDSISPIGGVYPASIYERFPSMLRRLALIYFALTGVGSLLISPPKAVPGQQAAPAATGKSLKAAVTSRPFWILWALALLSGTAGINVAGVYKGFGSTLHADDSFQSFVGSVAALANGFGRIFWGTLLDKAGFKRPFGALAAVQVATMAAYTTLSKSRVGFCAATCASLFCLGGNFAMFPVVTTKVFGGREGPLIYGVLFSAFAIASVSGTFITKALVSSFGWNAVFNAGSIMSVLVLALLSLSGSSIAV